MLLPCCLGGARRACRVPGLASGFSLGMTLGGAVCCRVGLRMWLAVSACLWWIICGCVTFWWHKQGSSDVAGDQFASMTWDTLIFRTLKMSCPCLCLFSFYTWLNSHSANWPPDSSSKWRILQARSVRFWVSAKAEFRHWSLAGPAWLGVDRGRWSKHWEDRGLCTWKKD